MWILSQEGADLKVLGKFSKGVTQAVLLFRADTWILIPSMERALSSFQHTVAQRLTGRKTRRRGDIIWEYPSLEEAMSEVGFEGIGTYITRMQNTFAQYIAMQPILDLCEWSIRRPGERVSWRWWEQDGLYLEGAKKRSEAESESDGQETIGKYEGMPLENMTGQE